MQVTIRKEVELSNPEMLPSTQFAIDHLFQSHADDIARVHMVAKHLNDPDMSTGMTFFEDLMENRPTRPPYTDVAGAESVVHAKYWKKAFDLTDVYDHMPQARRSEWNEGIRTFKVPPFERETVLATMRSLLDSRAQFFAERIDGIFQGLSRSHVTNVPQGFRTRMIMSGVNESYSTVARVNNHSLGRLDDLREVISKFTGSERRIGYGSTAAMAKVLERHRGEWISVDGGVLKMRWYMKGTIHVEIHQEIANRLNGVLASMYPQAIPSEFRTPGKRTAKNVDLIYEPLPGAVVEILGRLQVKRIGDHEVYKAYKDTNAFSIFDYTDDKYTDQRTKFARARVWEILARIGGVERPTPGKARGWFLFDYDPTAVIQEIATSGLMPDWKSHQFYPTPVEIAEYIVRKARIHETDKVLEPSSGSLRLANLFPVKENATLVEISKVHAKVAEQSGFTDVHRMDFLEFDDGRRFDKIVMNPPFSDGRAYAHIEHAITLLADKGEIFAILPAGMAKWEPILGYNLEVLNTFDDEFENTTVSVIAVRISR